MRYFLLNTFCVVVLNCLTYINGFTQSCDTLKIGKSNNLGIYGGMAFDLAFADNGRLFAACDAPASLFISDDSAKTWYHAFPND